MTKRKRYLFIGGPHDGERLLTAGEVLYESYVLITCHWSVSMHDTKVAHSFYVHVVDASKDILRTLLEGYRRAK
jgi:hypothetical protein